jgi:hypothetical protein
MQTPFTKLQDSRTLIPTPGSRIQLNTTSTPCGKLTVTALESNAGEVVYGGTTVVAALGTRSGTPLVPGQSVDIPIDDLSKVWLDTLNSNDGVSYTWLS